MSAALRVVLDTNVILSGLAYPGSVPGKIVAAWRHGSIDVTLSECILDELRRVLPRLAHRHGLTAAEIDDLVDILLIQAEVVDPVVDGGTPLRDRADLPVLGTLIAASRGGHQTCLITGDKGLLALADRFLVLTPAAFWARHGGPWQEP